MGFIKAFYMLLAVITLSACSVRYVERIPGVQPGYVDTQLGQDTYQVKIGEAWQKDWADFEKFALYRAAEITVSKNKRYFFVLNSSTQISTNYVTIPSGSTSSSTASVSGSTAYISTISSGSPSVTAPISGGWYTLDFRILSNANDAGKPKVIDSLQIINDYKIFIDGRR